MLRWITDVESCGILISYSILRLRVTVNDIPRISNSSSCWAQCYKTLHWCRVEYFFTGILGVNFASGWALLIKLTIFTCMERSYKLQHFNGTLLRPIYECKFVHQNEEVVGNMNVNFCIKRDGLYEYNVTGQNPQLVLWADLRLTCNNDSVLRACTILFMPTFYSVTRIYQ